MDNASNSDLKLSTFLLVLWFIIAHKYKYKNKSVKFKKSQDSVDKGGIPEIQIYGGDAS
jgi:hypothetical protein